MKKLNKNSNGAHTFRKTSKQSKLTRSILCIEIFLKFHIFQRNFVFQNVAEILSDTSARLQSNLGSQNCDAVLRCLTKDQPHLQSKLWLREFISQTYVRAKLCHICEVLSKKINAEVEI